MTEAPRDIPFAPNGLSTDPSALDHIDIGGSFLRIVLGEEYIYRGRETEQPPANFSLIGGVDRLVSAFEAELESLKKLGCYAVNVDWFLMFEKDTKEWPHTPDVVTQSFAEVKEIQSDAENAHWRRVYEYLPEGSLLVAKTKKIEIGPQGVDENRRIDDIAREYINETSSRDLGDPMISDFSSEQMRCVSGGDVVYLDIEPSLFIKCA